jgi:hypothetical protein
MSTTKEEMLLSAPSGNRAMTVIVSARAVRGPRTEGVGGAQPGAERR